MSVIWPSENYHTNLAALRPSLSLAPSLILAPSCGAGIDLPGAVDKLNFVQTGYSGTRLGGITRNYSCEMFLTEGQKALLAAFYLNELSNGTLPFFWKDSFGRTLFQSVFLSAPVYTATTGGYTASFSLAILP